MRKLHLLKIIFVFVCLFGLKMNFVKADDDVVEEYISLDCPNVILENSEFYCDVYLTSEEKVLGVKLNYEVSNELSFLGFVGNEELDLDSSNSSLSILSSAKIFGGKDYYLGTLKYKNLSNNGEMVVQNINVSAKVVYEDDIDNYHLIEGETKKIMPAKITDIFEKIAIGNISLELKDGVNDYSINVGDNIAIVDVVVNFKDEYKDVLDYNFDDVHGGMKDLVVGENKIHLTIYDDNYEVVEMNIIVNRALSNVLGDDNITENPKTGTVSVYIIILLLLISVGSIIFIKKTEGEVL